MTTTTKIISRRMLEDILDGIAYETKEADAENLRRSQWRIRYAMPATIIPEDSTEAERPIYVITRDISADGIGFVTHQTLRPGQKVTVILQTDQGDYTLPGTVRHVTISVGMYKIGIQFEY